MVHRESIDQCRESSINQTWFCLFFSSFSLLVSIVSIMTSQTGTAENLEGIKLYLTD